MDVIHMKWESWKIPGVYSPDGSHHEYHREKIFQEDA